MAERRRLDQVAIAWLGFFGSVVAFFAVVAVGEVLASLVFHIPEGEQISFGARLLVAPLTFFAISSPAIWGARVAIRARKAQLRGAELPLIACLLLVAYVLFVSVAGVVG